MHRLAATLVAVLAARPLLAQPVVIPTVPIGNPGNAPDTVIMSDGTTGYGDVGYDFEMGTHEVTNAQYAAFLNAVADSDPNNLFNPLMQSAINGGIARIGVDGSYTYTLRPGWQNKPVIFVSFFDAARFANWLHNNQPAGPQSVNTTEAGAYTLFGPTSIGSGDIDGNGRNQGWLWAVPSEDEWHKAAYGGAGDDYTAYATQSDTLPVSTTPPGPANAANYNNAVPLLTVAGAYTASPSFWGTFDQNGNVMEYNEGDMVVQGLRRVRGGSWDTPANALPADERGFGSNGSVEDADAGFRVVHAVPLTSAGACCLPGGGCTDGLSEVECTDAGGSFPGAGTLCSSVPCGIPTGACCLADGACLEAMHEVDCANINGLYQGDGVSCAAADCHPVGPILHVNAGAKVEGDGSSWAEALDNAQEALELAARFPGLVSQIWVAVGTYTPDYDNPGYRGAAFVLVSGVAMYGGFAGSENAIEERDVTRNPTILSGDLDGDDGPDFENNAENSYHVVVAPQQASAVTLDGFTISGGNADVTDYSDPQSQGGGMYNASSGAVIANCRFAGNSAAIRGGGLFNTALDTVMVDCDFVNNRVIDRGGGLSVAGPGALSVTGCHFELNHADFGGGVFSAGTAHPVFTDCTFSANVAGRGGAMRIEHNSHPAITGCDFLDNAAIFGGAFELWDDSTAAITNCRFIGCSSGERGGAIYLGSPVAARIHGCEFIGNGAEQGGAIYDEKSAAEVSNCTFSANTATVSGGAIESIVPPGATLRNCILWENAAPAGREIAGPATAAFCDVQGGHPGPGNIGADPLFANPTAGDFQLLPGSPCIDAGNNWAVPADGPDLDSDGDTAELSPLDLQGNPRLADVPSAPDAGCGLPVVVDMGASEAAGSPVNPLRLGDVDGDGAVGVVDFLLLLSSWGPCGGTCCLADLDVDGSVSISDFLLLLSSWT